MGRSLNSAYQRLYLSAFSTLVLVTLRHLDTSTPGTPALAMVGNSGKAGKRFAVLTPRAPNRAVATHEFIGDNGSVECPTIITVRSLDNLDCTPTCREAMRYILK